MKKSKILVIALIVCLVALGVGAVSLFGGNIGLGFTYANADKYTAGETTLTENVENLDIHWVSGNVKIEYHAGNEIRVTETANRTMSDEDQVRWWLDGTTLRIMYAKSGRFRLFDNLNKTLTVSLPEGAVLKKANIQTTSGTLDIPQLTADETELTVTSGNVNAAADTRKITVKSTSGDLNIRLAGVTEEATLEVTSGSILADIGDTKQLNVHGTSGNISVHGKAGNADIKTTSGTVSVRFAAINSLNINVTSGNVTAALPENPGFTCEASMTSGKFSSSVSLTNNGNVYACGDGSAKCSIHTTSGDIRIEKAD